MIRPYSTEDKEKLVDIFTLNVPKYFDPAEIKDFEDYLSSNAETYLTLEVESRIIGGTGYYVKEEDGSGRITWIFLHPEEAGKNYGKEVVTYCIEQLKADERVHKLVVTTSQHAYKFFEKFGYQVIQTEKNHWGLGLDLYLMEQPI